MLSREAIVEKILDDVLPRQILVRCMVETLPPNTKLRLDEGTATTIKLWDVTGDEHGNMVLLEVAYTCEERPQIGSYTNFTGIETNSIATGNSRNWKRKFYQNVWQLVEEWNRDMRCWYKPTPAAAFIKLMDGEFQETPTANFHLMQHFARFHTRIAYEIINHHEHGYWLCSVFYRLGAFIRDQNKQWMHVLGPIPAL